MLLELTTTHQPATDLGYLLHKHPARAQSFPLSFGQAHVYYPEATVARCTAALLLDVDPVGLVREGGGLSQYVNDRPYVCSSLLSVALAQVLGSALGGRCGARPELAAAEIPLQARLAVLPCRGGEPLLRGLFEPLGYRIAARRHGSSRFHAVTLSRTCRLQELLGHLYVLVPVTDDDKHYWVGDDELEKLLRHGEGWLADHPERELISMRYLKHRRSLARQALRRLAEQSPEDPDEAVARADAQEEAVEAPMGLNSLRLEAVTAELVASGARRVLDLGCGEGRLLRLLVDQRQLTRVVGLDVSWRALEVAGQRLKLERMPQARRERIELLHGSLLYRDERLAGFDAAAVVEVIEHLDPPRLAAFERVLFECARPGTVVLTTPNAEYNALFSGLPAGRLRHADHRFEWTRAQFEAWAAGVAERFGYRVRFEPIGPVDPALGAPTQMGVFERDDDRAA